MKELHIRKELLDSLKTVIVQDPVLLEDPASLQTWVDTYGQSASLGEIADKLHDAQVQVSEFTFFALEVVQLQSYIRLHLHESWHD